MDNDTHLPFPSNTTTTHPSSPRRRLPLLLLLLHLCAQVVMAIEEEFCIEIPDSEADKIGSVADAVAYITAHPMAK